MGRSLYFALLVATGCDVVFRLDDVDPPMSTIDASVAFDVCAAQPTDRSARYAFVTSSTAFIQATALYACAIRGMQLVSINDADELAALDGEIQQKLAMGSIYIGMNDVDNEGTWVGADGCPAYEAWGPAEPTATTLEDCVAIDGDGMFDGPCDQATLGFAGNRVAACEVGRWPTEECLAAARTPGLLSFDPTPRTLDEATAFCTQGGGKVLELESSVELQVARSLAGSTSFWLGARHTEKQWRRASGIACPQILPWQSDEPSYTVHTASGCAAHDSVGAEVRACTDTRGTICER